MGNKRGGDTLIAFAVLHVFSFSMFWGPTPWVYLGESFPLRVRAKVIKEISRLRDSLLTTVLVYCPWQCNK
jgi:Sugar (and other) transporter